jgi:hypothetical protein
VCDTDLETGKDLNAKPGPFSYGHFGVSDYQLTVDSIMFARRPTATDCHR